MLINYLNKIKIMLFYLYFLKQSTSFRGLIKTSRDKKNRLFTGGSLELTLLNVNF